MPTKLHQLNRYLLSMLMLSSLCLISERALSEKTVSVETPEPIGNFALRKSQRPGAFYSFGSKILEPGQVQLAMKPNIFKETGSRFIGSPNTIQFGTSEHTSFFIALPVTLDAQRKTSHGLTDHSGINNLGVQGEYEFLSHASAQQTENAGVLFGITAPTGARNVTSPWTSFFGGGTYTHAWVDWLFFSSAGYLVFEGSEPIRPGNIFYFEVGGGYNLMYESKKSNVNIFCEINGQSSEQDPANKLNLSGGHSLGALMRPSGSALSDGYLLYVSPSLWYSNNDWIVQLGGSIPIAQRWANTPEKVDYYASLAVLYTLN
ncbi:MAG: hypothetical protein NTW08_04545 [Gammaproteobacteria bacterium]|nr:hypothetical protein [Gammaproteobacteria bacterium]